MNWKVCKRKRSFNVPDESEENHEASWSEYPVSGPRLANRDSLITHLFFISVLRYQHIWIEHWMSLPFSLFRLFRQNYSNFWSEQAAVSLTIIMSIWSDTDRMENTAFVCSCVCIRCRGNVTEPLLSNDRGIHIQAYRLQCDINKTAFMFRK